MPLNFTSLPRPKRKTQSTNILTHKLAMEISSKGIVHKLSLLRKKRRGLGGSKFEFMASEVVPLDQISRFSVGMRAKVVSEN